MSIATLPAHIVMFAGRRSGPGWGSRHRRCLRLLLGLFLNDLMTIQTRLHVVVLIGPFLGDPLVFTSST